MSERFKEHAWKACVGETQPWVRIPPSPPYFNNTDETVKLLLRRARHYSVTLGAVNQLSKMEMLLGSIKVNLIPIPLPLSE